MWAIRKPTSVGVKNSPGALARALGELAQQVLVGAAEEVGLHVGEAEPVARVGEGLDHAAQLGRVDVTLAVALGGEVDHVDDARQRRGCAGRRRAPPW